MIEQGQESGSRIEAEALDVPDQQKLTALTACEHSKASSLSAIQALHPAHREFPRLQDDGALGPETGQAIASCPAIAALNLVGLSFRTADLGLRSQISFVGERLSTLLQRLKDAGVAECVALCTCNRTEIIFFGDDAECVPKVMAEVAGVELSDFESHLYSLHGPAACEHLFRVCSGLDSAVLGETEIVAQVKSAWQVAQHAGCANTWMNLLMRHALSVSKRVRSETDLSRGTTSLGTQAVRVAAKLAGGLEGKRVLLLGAGKIIERVAGELASERPQSVTIANRTKRNAAVVANRHGFESCDLDRLAEQLTEADLVLTAIGSQEPPLNEELLAGVVDRRAGCRLTVVDLGVPPNVSAGAKRLPGLAVVDIDAVIEGSASNVEQRMAAVPSAGIIVEEAVDKFVGAFSEREAAPAIHALVDRCEILKEQNLAWAMERLPGLDEREQKVVQDFAFRMVRGFLESPIRALKSREVNASERELIVRMFGNGSNSDSDTASALEFLDRVQAPQDGD